MERLASLFGEGRQPVLLEHYDINYNQTFWCVTNFAALYITPSRPHALQVMQHWYKKNVDEQVYTRPVDDIKSNIISRFINIRGSEADIYSLIAIRSYFDEIDVPVFSEDGTISFFRRRYIDFFDLNIPYAEIEISTGYGNRKVLLTSFFDENDLVASRHVTIPDMLVVADVYYSDDTKASIAYDIACLYKALKGEPLK